MAAFSNFVKLFRTELSCTVDMSSTDLVPVINIELEELGHSGRRSLERKRRRRLVNPISVKFLIPVNEFLTDEGSVSHSDGVPSRTKTHNALLLRKLHKFLRNVDLIKTTTSQQQKSYTLRAGSNTQTRPHIIRRTTYQPVIASRLSSSYTIRQSFLQAKPLYTATWKAVHYCRMTENCIVTHIGQTPHRRHYTFQSSSSAVAGCRWCGTDTRLCHRWLF